MDYIVDIDSSIYYPDRQKFLREVKAALKEDGTFLYAAIITATSLKQYEQEIKD